MARGIRYFLLFFAFQILLTHVSPDFGWEDAGELTTAAFHLSIAHPTGFPSYIQAVKAFQLLPLGSIAYRSNLLSTCFVFFTLLLLFTLLNQKTKSSGIGLIAVLSFCCTPHLLVQSATTDIYTMQVFFVAVMFLIVFSEERSSRKIIGLYQKCLIIGLLTGLGNSIQPFFILYALPFMGLLLLGRKREASSNLLLMLIVLLLFLLGLSSYLYLIIRGGRSFLFHWGPITTWSEFGGHVSALSYRQGFPEITAIPSPTILYHRLLQLYLTLKSSWLPILWPLIVVGMVPRNRSDFFRISIVLVLLVDVGYTLFINPMGIKALQTSLVALFCCSMALGNGIHLLLERLDRYKSSK